MASLDQNSHFQAAPVRGEVYRYLARLLTFPDDELKMLATSGELDARLADALAHIPYGVRWCTHIDRAGAELEREFMRLFELPVGGHPCSLYGGMYGGNRRSTMEELLRYYRHFGLSVEGAAEKDLPDSIPTVLEFMQFLCLMETRAACLDSAKTPRAAQKDLLGRHLTHWTPLICQRLRDMNPAPIYRDAAAVLNDFCVAELTQFNAA